MNKCECYIGETDSLCSPVIRQCRLCRNAPALLEALKAIMSRAQGLLDGEPDTQYLFDKLGPEYRAAQAAIAEVEGRGE